MKQCPNCKGFELYDDAESRCPYCSTVLVPYIRANSRPTAAQYAAEAEPVRPTSQNTERRETQPQFEEQSAGGIRYRGIVDSINPTSRFMTPAVKWANAFFLGQPYQIGNPVHETIVRIEEISRNRLPDRLRSLVYYGELGELDIGDDVTITAVERKHRLIIRSIRINDTESSVRPKGQISAAVIRILSCLCLALIVYLVGSLIYLFTSGGIWTVLSALVGALVGLAGKLLVACLPIAVLVFVFWLFFHKQ